MHYNLAFNLLNFANLCSIVLDKTVKKDNSVSLNIVELYRPKRDWNQIRETHPLVSPAGDSVKHFSCVLGTTPLFRKEKFVSLSKYDGL